MVAEEKLAHDVYATLGEETDIADLKEVIVRSEPAAVDPVMNRLHDASYNHWAAFERQLK